MYSGGCLALDAPRRRLNECDMLLVDTSSEHLCHVGTVLCALSATVSMLEI